LGVLRPTALLRSICIALALLACSAGLAADSKILGAEAPDFTLPALRGGNQRLSDRLGEVVLLNFWDSPCNVCRKQVAKLDDLAARYASDGLVVLGINLDGDKRRTAAAVGALNVSYPILLDNLKNVSRSYQVDKMPVTVLIDRQGTVRYVATGFRLGSEKLYTDKLRELLEE
jgi:peroxiredoxin